MSKITRNYRESIQSRIKQDPEFAIHLLDEALSLIFNNEPETARLILRELVNATIGFEDLALKTHKPSKSLHRMLSATGNPTMDNLTNIIDVLSKNLKVNFEIHAIPIHT